MIERPYGWRHNPSAWTIRGPLVTGALIGALIAACLTAFQLGWLASVPDPLFGSQDRTVLTIWHFPDAAAGCLAYLAEAALGLVGGTDRWRRHPALVLAYTLVAWAMAAASMLLVLIMAVWLDAGCLLCLVSALLSWLLAGAILDEGLATMQELVRRRAEAPCAGLTVPDGPAGRD